MLLFADGAGRAGILAGAAVDADIGIDAVDVAFDDCAGRAFALAGSASNASFRIDFVCHSLVELLVIRFSVLFKYCAKISFCFD